MASPCLQNRKLLSFAVPGDSMPRQSPLWGILGGMCQTISVAPGRWSTLGYKELSAHEQMNLIDGFCNGLKGPLWRLVTILPLRARYLSVPHGSRGMGSEEFAFHDCFKSRMREGEGFKLQECLITKALCSPGVPGRCKQMPAVLIS